MESDLEKIRRDTSGALVTAMLHESGPTYVRKKLWEARKALFSGNVFMAEARAIEAYQGAREAEQDTDLIREALAYLISLRTEFGEFIPSRGPDIEEYTVLDGEAIPETDFGEDDE